MVAESATPPGHAAVVAAPRPPARASRLRRDPPDRAERRIVRGLRRADERALEAVYARHGAPTFAFLLRRLGDRAAAEDVNQQVFTEVWKRGADYDPQRASLSTWIMTIARSRAIDHLRKRVPEPYDPQVTVHLADDAGGTGFDEQLVERWRLTAALQTLPPQERALLRMRFCGGYSQTEIAELSGVPLGTVKARMVRALERLRETLEAGEGVS